MCVYVAFSPSIIMAVCFVSPPMWQCNMSSFEEDTEEKEKELNVKVLRPMCNKFFCILDTFCERLHKQSIRKFIGFISKDLWMESCQNNALELIRYSLYLEIS